MFIISALRLGSAAFAAIAVMSTAQAQAELAPILQPTLNAEVLSFQCKKSFTGKGLGTCAGRIDVIVQNIDRPLRTAEFKCDVVVKYWWKDGQERRWEMKSLNLSTPAERLGISFASASLLFETDITSVVREPQEAHIAKTRCDVTWR